MKNLYFYFLIFCLSCNNNSLLDKDNNVDNGVEYIRINPDDISKEYTAKASYFIDSVSYIPLQTTDDCLLAGIDRIIFQNNKYYIYDISGDQLCVFSSDGTFITKIGKKGHGPGEYAKIEAFSVDSLDNTFIYCEQKQSVLEYDKNANFVREQNIGLAIADFIVCENEMLFYTKAYKNSSSEIQSRLVALHENGSKRNFLKWKFTDLFVKYYGTTNGRLFHKNENTVSLIEEIGNSIYQFSDSLPILRYKLDFGEYTIPLNFEKEVILEAIEVQMKNKCKLNAFVECKDYIYISFSFKNKYIFKSLYLKQKQQVLNFGPFWYNDIDNIFLPNIIASVDNKLIGVGESYFFKEQVENNGKASQKVKNISEKITGVDNPIVYVIHFKTNVDE